MTLTSASLKAKQRENDVFGEDYSIRVSRAISWLRAAEETPSIDLKVISLWIAYNACYAVKPTVDDAKEHENHHRFLELLIKADEKQRIYKLFWDTYTGPIRVLINNQFIYRRFWQYHRGEVTEWEQSFKRENDHIFRLLMHPNKSTELVWLVLQRLYQMRNQLVHGGATFEGKVNRDQVKDSAAILGSFVPVVIDIMLNHRDLDWGSIHYPVIR